LVTIPVCPVFFGLVTVMNSPPSDPPNLRLVPSECGQPRAREDSPATQGQSFKPGLLAIVPSWLFSLVLHAGLLVLLAASLPGLRGGIVGDPDGDLRSVGIWVGQSGDGSDPEKGSGGAKSAAGHTKADGQTKIVPTAPTEPIAPAIPVTAAPLNVSPSIAPVLAHPKDQPAVTSNDVPTLPILGPGERPERPGMFRPSAQPSSNGGKIGSADSAGNGRGPRGSRGLTPFFGIVDIGSRFVYVIDCSGSMFSHDAIKAAKNELVNSLRTLNRAQQFQIVFYSTEQKWLKVPGKVDFRFFSADEISLRRANEFIAEIQPDGGTQHLTAIELALRLRPDVLFFLTDGGKPGLSSVDLEELKRLNERHTRIHCVQFRSDDDEDAVAAEEFLRKLAAQNDGQYVCRDVSRFDAPSVPRSAARPSREEP
jgi:Ca-activated chloride channel family protein